MLVEFCHTSSGASWIKRTKTEEKKNSRTSQSEYKEEKYRILHMHARCAYIQHNCECISNTENMKKKNLNNEIKKRGTMFFVSHLFECANDGEQKMKNVCVGCLVRVRRSLHAVGWTSFWFRELSRNRLVFVKRKEFLLILMASSDNDEFRTQPAQGTDTHTHTQMCRWQCHWKMVYCFRLKSA